MTTRRSRAVQRVALAAGLTVGLAAAAPAAAQAAPVLSIEPNAPQFVREGQTVRTLLIAQNRGDEATTGPITVEVDIPAGLTFSYDDLDVCVGTTTVTCTLPSGLGPQQYASVNVFSSTDPGTSGPLTIDAEISGGGSAAARGSTSFTVTNDNGEAGWRSFTAGLFNWDGTSFTQAGGHPYAVTTTLQWKTRTSEPIPGFALETPIEQIKNAVVQLPKGLVGDPSATEVCSTEDFIAIGPIQQTGCQAESQVGIARLRDSVAAIYNIEPPRGSPAAFGFHLQSVPIVLTASLENDGEYSLAVGAKNAATTVPVMGMEATFWGVPADPRHDYERPDCLLPNLAGSNGTACPLADSPPERAFLTAPTSCSADQLGFDASFTTHESPGTVRDTSSAAAALTGCDAVPFEPQVSVRPTVTTPDSPTGLDFELNVPFSHDPGQLGQAHLKDATVLLPEGMTISPSSADGLGACTDEQLKLGSSEAAACPDASKIGTANLVTPLLNEPVSGSIFLRTQASNDPASGNMFRAVIELRNDDRGVNIKLPGRIAADPATGRIAATFDNNPQLPFTNLRLHFKDGPRAPLANPATCGPKTVNATLVGWNGKTVQRTDAFSIDCTPNLGAFTPTFSAGSGGSVKAGDSTAFALRVNRGDGQQTLNGLTVRLPPGLLARLSSVPQCGDAEANAGTCGEASRVGTATIGAGPGSNPFHIAGGAYLTGPYKQGAFGLAVKVRVLAGPFDLGTVVVRQQLQIDRADAHVTVVSDSLPTIVGGVPIRLRSLAVDIDRPGFMINPTSCAPSTVGGVLGAANGQTLDVSSRFQVTGCTSLPFKPKMTFRVGARGRTRAGVSTPLNATLTMPNGNAANRVVRVNLPRTLNARLEVLSNEKACSLDQYNQESCPISIGTASAITPLLKEPLTGKVYLVRNPARRLPDMVVALKGSGDSRALQIDLTGKIDITRDLTVRTAFDTIPDAPISRFDLRLVAGRNGPLGTVNNLCTKTARRTSLARLAFQGQNGRRLNANPRISVVGCKKATSRRAARKPSSRRTSKKATSKKK